MKSIEDDIEEFQGQGALNDVCGFCGHLRSSHCGGRFAAVITSHGRMIGTGDVKPGDRLEGIHIKCWGKPACPDLDANGECPCLGFQECNWS
jgi:hypothetical protein